MKNRINSIKPIWYLVFGVVIMTFTHMTFSIGLLAWISSVPFLIYLNKTKGWRSRTLFILALIVSWSFIVFKIITPPVPLVFILFYSLPLTLFHLPGYLMGSRFKKYKFSFLIFPVVMTIMEWIQYSFTPFGSWGIAAYTQSQNLALMQTVSLFGIAGLSFLIYWINITITELVLKGKAFFPSFRYSIIVLIALILFGSIRFDKGKAKGVETITVAAVGTDSEVNGLPLPSEDSNEKVKSSLFERTKNAAKSGAKIIVWNEASTFIFPEEESNWIESLSSLSVDNEISLIAAYVVLVSEAPFKYENKFVFIDSGGKLVYSYNKHQPVPGEPASKGKEELKVIDIDGIRTGGVICYDYDFPYLAKAYGKLNADIVAIPSSDWRGIDPLHSRMAAFRAVEQGHSIIRSTRFGLSAAITPYGEMIAQMSSFDTNNKIMIAHLPSKGVKTFYAIVGDVFVYLCFTFMLLALIMLLFFRKKLISNK